MKISDAPTAFQQQTDPQASATIMHWSENRPGQSDCQRSPGSRRI